MEYYPEILSKVTTPLALAALFFLLLFGVLVRRFRDSDKKSLRDFTRYGFWIAITLVVLSTASYVIIHLSRGEVLFRGTISDESDQPLGNVVVDVVGISRGISDDNGYFLVAIPSNSSSPKYKVSFHAVGYKNASDTPSSLPGPEPEPVTVHLQSEKLDGAALLNVLHVRFGHLVGLPALWVHLFVRNPLAKIIELNGISASLTAPNGKSFFLYYAGWAPNMQATFSSPGLTNIPIYPGQTSEMALYFAPPPTPAGFIWQQIQTDNAPQTNPTPRLSGQVMSDQLATNLKQQMLDNMQGSAGKWTLDLSTIVAGKSYSNSLHFNLDSQAIADMEKIATYYKWGKGIGVYDFFQPWAGVDPTIWVQVTN